MGLMTRILKASMLVIFTFSILLTEKMMGSAEEIVYCSPENSPLWHQAELLIIEGKSLIKQGSDMASANQSGWRDIVNKGSAKSNEGYQLKDQLRRKARQCRQNARNSFLDKAKEKSNEVTDSELEAKILDKIKSKFPNFSKNLDLANSQYQLLNNSNDLELLLENVTNATRQLRALPKQPPVNPAWQLSGDLSQYSTDEYHRLVTDSIEELMQKLSDIESLIQEDRSNLKRDLKEHVSVERSWDKRRRSLQQSRKRKATKRKQTTRKRKRTNVAPSCPSRTQWHNRCQACRGSSNYNDPCDWE